jgi:hypothetical protein
MAERANVSDFNSDNRSHHKDLSAPLPDGQPCPIHRQLPTIVTAEVPVTKIISIDQNAIA